MTWHLIERERDVEIIIAHYRKVSKDGQSRLVHLTGPGGIGKTSLIDAFVAANADLPILRGRAEELEDNLPYGPIRHAVGQLLRQPVGAPVRPLAERIAELTRTGDSAAQLPELMRHLLRALSAPRQPAIIALDDMHDADRDSNSLISRILRSTIGPPVFMIFGSRPGNTKQGSLGEPLSSLLDRMSQEGLALTLDLKPLSRTGVSTLGRAMLGREPTHQLADYVHDATGGVPFYASRLYESLRRDGHVTAGERADLTPRSMAATAHQDTIKVSGHLPPLTTTQKQVARALAVLGRVATTAPEILIEISALPEPQVRLAILELTELGVLDADGDGWIDFRHPILRSIVYNSTPVATRAALHDHAAAALRRTPAAVDRDPFSFATHLDRGVSATIEERRAAAIRASELAGTSAPMVAAYWAGKVAQSLPAGDPVRILALTEQAGLYMSGTATREAFEPLLQAIKEGGADLDREHPMWLYTMGLFFAGRREESTLVTTQEFQDHPENRAAVAGMLATLAQNYRSAEAAELYPVALESALHGQSNAHKTVYSLSQVLSYVNLTERTADRDLIRTEYTRLLPTIRSDLAAEQLNGFGTQIGTQPGALREAVAAIAESNRLRGRRQLMSAWGLSEMSNTNVAWLTGEWSEALEIVEATVWADEIGGNIHAAQMLRSLGGIILAQRGEHDQAESLVAAVHEQQPAASRAVADLARSLLLDDAAATALLLDTVTQYLDLGYFSLLGALADELYRRSRSTPSAEQVVPLIEQVLARTVDPLNRMWLLHAVGSHRRDRALLEEALGLAQDEGVPFEEARIQLTIGTEFEDTAAVLAASAGFEKLEARPWHTEAARIGRSLGLRLHVPRSASDGLNETELRVARLVAEGLTNREVASRLSYSVKRIEAVLTTVFRKLGIRRRYELIARYQEDPELFQR